LTIAATSDFTCYGDRSGGHSGTGGREFASYVVSRRPRPARRGHRQLSVSELSLTGRGVAVGAHR
jgi:hypothetical protein